MLIINTKQLYSILQKVMHTRKRHMELFQELNQKFQTLDRFRDVPKSGSMVSMEYIILTSTYERMRYFLELLGGTHHKFKII